MSNAQNPCDIPLYTDWFIEILIMAFYNPHKTMGSIVPKKNNKSPGCWGVIAQIEKRNHMESVDGSTPKKLKQQEPSACNHYHHHACHNHREPHVAREELAFWEFSGGKQEILLGFLTPQKLDGNKALRWL